MRRRGEITPTRDHEIAPAQHATLEHKHHRSVDPTASTVVQLGLPHGRAGRPDLARIPVERIVGSVDRSDDFRRDFRPQRRLSRGRLASLRSRNPTDADLILWIYKLRRDLRARDATVDFDAAAAQARKTSRHERMRREVRREGSRPLPRRRPQDAKE